MVGEVYFGLVVDCDLKYILRHIFRLNLREGRKFNSF